MPVKVDYEGPPEVQVVGHRWHLERLGTSFVAATTIFDLPGFAVLARSLKAWQEGSGLEEGQADIYFENGGLLLKNYLVMSANRPNQDPNYQGVFKSVAVAGPQIERDLIPFALDHQARVDGILHPDGEFFLLAKTLLFDPQRFSSRFNLLHNLLDNVHKSNEIIQPDGPVVFMDSINAFSGSAPGEVPILSLADIMAKRTVRALRQTQINLFQ